MPRVDDEHLDVRRAAVYALARSGGIRRAYASLQAAGLSEESANWLLDELEYLPDRRAALTVLESLHQTGSAGLKRAVAKIRRSMNDLATDEGVKR